MDRIENRFDGVDGVGNEEMPGVGPGDSPSRDGSPPEDLKKPSPDTDGNGIVPDAKKSRKRKPSSSGRKRKRPAKGTFSPEEIADAAGTDISLNEKETQRRTLLDEFRHCADEELTATWKAALLAHRLHHEFGMKRCEIVLDSGVSEQRVGQYIHAVEAAMEAQEETGEDFTKSLTVEAAYQAHVGRRTFRDAESDTTTIGEMMRLCAAGTTPRKLRSKAAAKGKQFKVKSCLADREKTAEADWRMNCYEGDCRDLFDGRLPLRSVKLIHADVPYADHRRAANKGYSSGRQSTSACLFACANNTYDTALQLTCDIIRKAEPFLVEGGVFALWQAGSRPLRAEIQQAISEGGLHVAFELHLDKASGDESSEAGQPGGFSEPYTIASEKLVIIKRPTDELVRCDHGLPRGDLIKRNYLQQAVKQFEEERGVTLYSWGMHNPNLLGAMPGRRAFSELIAGRSDWGDAHEMQKPEEMGLYLLLKHCMPGDFVVDVCGCSASFCISADQFGCNWLYCDMPTKLDEDSNQTDDSGNFAFGVSRLSEYFDWKRDRLNNKKPDDEKDDIGDNEAGSCVVA